MGKNFARKIATLLLSFAMVFSCLFVFSACKDKGDPADEVKVTSISVELAENSPYTLTENVLDVFYNGSKIEFSSSDFVVTANKSNNTTVVLSQKTNTADGYEMSSTIPAEGVTAVGEYKLTFSYTGVSNVEIQVKVNKGNIDVSGVTLTSLTYNGAEQTLQVEDILNLPQNVTAEFVSGNSGTTVQNYEAVVRFTYTGADAESYNAIPDATITWTIQKASYDMSNVSWVGGENIVYTGAAQTVEIEVDGELPEGVTIKGYVNNEKTNAGSYTAKVQFNYDTLNYNKPAVEDFVWVIKKAPLTVTAKEAEITFGEPAINNGVTYSGFVNSETYEVLGGELSYEYGAYHVGSNVATYDILPSGLSAENYEISYVKGNLIVNKAIYSYDAITWEYDGPYSYNNNVQKPTVKGVPELVGYDVVARVGDVSGNEDESVNAGSYTAVFTVLDFTNYTFTGTIPTQEYVINQVALSITANDNTITFGDEPSHSGVLAEGFKGADNLDIFAGQEFVYDYNYVKGNDAGTYTITVSGVTSNNYIITFHTGTLNVQAITLQYSSIEFDYSEPFNYNGQSVKLTVSGVPNYVDYSIAYTKGGNTAVPKDAGTYVASFVAQESINYVYMGQVAKQEFRINKISLVITANDNEISFGSEPNHAGVTYSGFVNGENELVLGGTLLYTYGGYEVGADIGDYDIEISGKTAVNYDISYVSGTLTVNPIQVNVSAYTWNYTSLTYSGVAQEPKLNEISSYIQANYTYTQNDAPAYPINVGSYTASVTFNTSTNYEVIGTVADLPFAIGKAPLVVTANDHEITYQDAAANNGVTYTGFVNGETETVLSGELVFDYAGYVAGSPVANYAITPSGLTSSNYEISYEPGNLRVKKIIVEVSNFAWNYTAAYTYSGVPQKPELTSYPNYLTFDSYTYTKDLVEDDSINAGTYFVIANFEESQNYEIEEDVTLEYVINKKALVVTAKDHTITYQDEASNAGVTYSGFVNDETFAMLGGTLVFDYDGYTQESNAGTYRITVSGLTSANYEISYVAGLLTVEAMQLNYSDYSFNYVGTETFVYNGTAVVFEIQMLPDFVQYDIVYKLNDETVVSEAVNAGSYTVTFVPKTSINYIFSGEALKVPFTIEKATIDETQLYFVFDGSTDGISVNERYENQVDTLVIYSASYYCDSMYHQVDFVNNTGVGGISFRYTIPDGMRTQIKNVGHYSIGVDIEVSSNVLNNYEELEYTQYVLELNILEIFNAFKVTYTDGTEVITTDEIPFYSYQTTTYSVNGLILGVEVVYTDEELESIYTANLYTDRTYTTYVFDVDSNLNVYDNTLYVGVEKGGTVFDDRAIKFVLTFRADTSSDIYMMTNEVQYSTSDSAVKSINVDMESITFYNNCTMSGVEASCDIGYYEDVLVPDLTDESGYPVYQKTVVFTDEAYDLTSGINELFIRYNYTYAEKTYSYTRAVNIVYSLRSDNHFTITYTTNNYSDIARGNAINVSDVTIEDILGNDITSANPEAAIEDICKNITVESKTNGNYEEAVGENGESLRTIEVSNGNAYLVIPVKEKPDNGFVDFGPGFQGYSVTESGDGNEASEEIIYIYIRLNFGFEIDFNTNADINADGGVISNFGGFGYIQMKTGQFLHVMTENQYAPILVAKIGNTLEDLEGLEMVIPDNYELYYGILPHYSFYETGIYALVIMPTVSIFGAEYEPMVYIIDVAEGDGEGGGYVPSEIDYNIYAEDILAQGVNNTGVTTNNDLMSVIEEVEGVITLTNWDNTKYLIIETNGIDDNFFVSLNQEVIINKYASHFVMNFTEAGTYEIVITRTLQSEEGTVSKTIVVNVSGFERNFLNITSNGNDISVDLTRTKDFVSEEAVSYNDMISGDEKFYIEAYIGNVSANAGSIYNLELTSVYADKLYVPNTDTEILYANGKVALEVKNDGTFNYVEFEIKNLELQEHVYAPESIVRVYFCEKSARLKYQSLTIGSSAFDFALNLTRAGDYGDLITDYETGYPKLVIEETDTTDNMTAVATFAAYAGYTKPADSYEYLVLTEEAYYSLIFAVCENLTVTNRAELTAFIDSQIQAGKAFYLSATPVNLTLEFIGGASMIYVACEDLTYDFVDSLTSDENEFAYFEMLLNYIAPIQITINGVYEEGGYPGEGGESIVMTVIDMYYNEFEETLSLYTDFSGDFVLDTELTDYETTAVFVAEVDAEFLTGEVFTFNGIEYNAMLIGSFDVVDGVTETPILVQNFEDGDDVYTISENVELTVMGNTAILQINSYVDEEKQELDMTYLFVINFVEAV